VFIDAVHARLTTANLQMSCSGSRPVVRTMAPSPFYRFALWLVRLLPDLLLCLTGSPPRLFAPKRRNQTNYLHGSAKKYSLKLFAIFCVPVCNSNAKIHTLIIRLQLHTYAEQHLILSYCWKVTEMWEEFTTGASDSGYLLFYRFYIWGVICLWGDFYENFGNFEHQKNVLAGGLGPPNLVGG